MNTQILTSLFKTIGILAGILSLAACASTEPGCPSPQTRNLDSAISFVKTSLETGCEAHFDRYYDDLLTIAEGDPKPENKRIFSDFLIWTTDRGILSQRQAKEYYNRYFNVKFVTLAGDYNTCSSACVRRETVIAEMEQELRDKERGLLQVARDADGYYRADRLFQESELVLEATCRACGTQRSAAR